MINKEPEILRPVHTVVNQLTIKSSSVSLAWGDCTDLIKGQLFGQGKGGGVVKNGGKIGWKYCQGDQKDFQANHVIKKVPGNFSSPTE